MRISTRLLIAISIAVTIVMIVYGLIALRQREALLADALARETETLARTLQITTNNALRDERLQDLNDVLEQVADDPETYAAAVLSDSGTVFAGGPPSAIGCLERYAPLARQIGEVGGWADCDGRVRWIALETRTPGSAIVVARRATVIERDIVASRWRMSLTTLALAMAAGLAIMVVLRTSLSRPLAEVMRGVQSLGAGTSPTEIRVGGGSGEITALAASFNEMAARLEDKQASLMREVEERLALERRLRKSEKFAALGRLTGGLAHELGSPLNVIGVRAEAIVSRPEDAPEARRQAEEILSEVERVAELMHGLSHVARRHRVKSGPVDLASVVADVLAEVANRVESLEIELERDLPREPAMILGDATLLHHAVLNLVTNAIQSLAKAEPPRTLYLRLSRETVPSSGEATWTLIVEDDGPGITDEDLAHVFEPFFTTKDVGEGMGLGLAISLGIVEEHQGSLTVEPPPGGGVRTVIRLPIRSEAELHGPGGHLS